jgi:RNA-directed DNA polymerase
MSLSPQTIRIQRRLSEWTQRGRKHWDLYRWVFDPFVLSDAIKLVIRNGGTAGPDGMQVSELKGREWEIAMQLSRDIRSGAYQPGAVRRVYIPKADGRERPLGIPNVLDRVVQRALALLLEPIYEQVFLPCSYGFRPRCKSVQCIALVAQTVYDHRQVLDADIEDFFGQVVHRRLLGMLKEKIVDPRVLRLIHRILRSGFCEWGKPWQATAQGTPQGGPVSPMLANIYLHYALDVKLWPVLQQSRGRIHLYRFADDFVVVGRERGEMQFIRNLIAGWLAEAGLNLHPKKTRLVDMRNSRRGYDSHFDFLGYRIHLRAYRDNPKRFWIARQPSLKARKALHDNLRNRLVANASLTDASQICQQVWRGWANYFRYGNSNRILYKECHSVSRAFWRYLRRKYRRQRRPVPWRVLRVHLQRVKKQTRPPRCIPDLLRQRPRQLRWA